MTKSSLICAAALGALVMSAGCERVRGGERIVVGGSSAVLPLMRHAASSFCSQHPTVTIEVAGGGSALGLEQLKAGAIDIGDADTTPPVDAALLDHRVGATVFAFVTNGDDVTHTGARRSLTRDELRRIFAGELTDWAELGGKPGPIFVINRPPGSGTRSILERVIFGGIGELAKTAPVEENSGTVVRTLLALPGSISYVALPYVEPPLIALAIDGVAPTADNVLLGTYPFWSFGHMVTRNPARLVVQSFVDYVLSPAFQAEAPARLRFIPITRFADAREPQREQP